MDRYSKFTVEVLSPSQIRLRADNGCYLSQFCCFRGISAIAIYLTTPDAYSVFTVETVSPGKVRLKAVNGNYLKRVYYSDMRKSAIGVIANPDQSGIFDIAIVG